MEEEVLGKAYDGRLMRRLLAYIRPYKSEVLIALVFLLINAALQVVGPLLTKLAIDRYLAKSAKVAQDRPLAPEIAAIAELIAAATFSAILH